MAEKTNMSYQGNLDGVELMKEPIKSRISNMIINDLTI